MIWECVRLLLDIHFHRPHIVWYKSSHQNPQMNSYHVLQDMLLLNRLVATHRLHWLEYYCWLHIWNDPIKQKQMKKKKFFFVRKWMEFFTLPWYYSSIYIRKTGKKIIDLFSKYRYKKCADFANKKIHEENSCKLGEYLLKFVDRNWWLSTYLHLNRSIFYVFCLQYFVEQTHILQFSDQSYANSFTTKTTLLNWKRCTVNTHEPGLKITYADVIIFIGQNNSGRFLWRWKCNGNANNKRS